MAWRAAAFRLFDSAGFRGVLAVAFTALVFLPALLFGWSGLWAVVGVVFGFAMGYSFARKEWSRRGYVPRYDDVATPPDQ